ncbi:MAG TPA: hypothetical protein VKV04_13990 [Verrucomicrobiae bacterium]|nr:hypothetical protein [Verrucomicrobiae bacterium]
MQSIPLLPSLKSPDSEASPFNVVIAYEDFETGKRAMKVYNYIVEHLSDKYLFQNQMWKFEVLAVAKLRQMAVKDASAADIVIVSTHGTNELPAEAASWIKSSAAEQNNLIALVGLFDLEEHLDNPARRFLADTAQRHGIEFFSQPGVWPSVEDKDQQRPLDARGERNEKTFSILHSAVQENAAVFHWGINE